MSGRFEVSGTGGLPGLNNLWTMLGVGGTSSEHNARTGETIGRLFEQVDDDSDRSGSSRGFGKLHAKSCDVSRDNVETFRDTRGALGTDSTKNSSSQATRSKFGDD